jgi:hypothetical protein
MIKSIKYFVVIIVIIITVASSCRVSHPEFVDVDGMPIIWKTTNKEVTYQKKDGSKIKAYLGGVEFNGNRDSLRHYLNNIFYNSPYYDSTQEDAFNRREIFFLLFDSELNIVEVRIKRSPYDLSYAYYYHIFIDGLKRSKGQWHKTVKGEKWYIGMIPYLVF